MREKRVSQEPDDETRPNKSASTGSFLASWLTGLERKEANLKDSEADIDNPEEVGKKPDGFSKRWHKLFRGVFGKPELMPKADETRLDKLRDNAKKAAHSSEDMAEIVAEGQTADHLSDHEIVATKPAKPDWEALTSEPPEAIPRVDPAEIRHEDEYEDNLEAPGAPTKGYRGLLKVDHSDEHGSIKKAAETEALTTADNPPETKASKKDDYILPKQPPKPLENYHYLATPKDSELSLPLIDRRIQSVIDRPALILPPELTGQMASMHRNRPPMAEPVTPPQQPEKTSVPRMEAAEASAEPTERAYELSHESKNLPSAAPVSDDSNAQVPEPTPTTGATPVGSILSASPRYMASAQTKPPAPETPVEKTLSPKPTPSQTSRTPGPIYTPPAPVRPTAPSIYNSPPTLDIPVIEPDRYRQAMINGFWGGMIVSAIVAIIYLFG